MRKFVSAICVSTFFLAACAQEEQVSQAEAMIERVEPPRYDDEGVPKTEFGFMEAMQPGIDPFGSNRPAARYRVATTEAPAREEATAPSDGTQSSSAQGKQIAYSYGFGFQVEAGKIARLQQLHVALCQKLGDGCRILRLSQATADSWDGYGELKLQVASDRAVLFGEGLEKPAQDLGGELVSAVRDGDDLSEQIIDTEARLSSRLLLRDKLTNILRDNRGSVDELVKAEKAVAEVNEEIDATRSKLQQYRNRISYSAVNIEYEPYFGEGQMGFGRPVMTALRSIGTTMGMSVATLIYMLTAAIPVVLLVFAIRWTLHRFGFRIRFWKRTPAARPTEPA